MRSKHGFTLAEIMVVCSLLFLIFGVVAELVMPPIFLFQKQSARSGAEQSVMLALAEIRSGLLQTSPDTVTVSNDHQSLALQPLVDDVQPYTSNGSPLLQDHFVLFCADHSDHQLVRRKRSPAGFDFSKACQLDRPTLANLSVTAQSDDRVLLRDLKSLTFGDPGPATVFPLHVTISVKIKELRKEDTWTLEARVTPRNGR